ncbi:unnamed protein product [Plutella xylostella]|uniref:(diamondback moth) hypothetical protein n=1 Tax=Plutella xylostella TaxID=51655 RepID=A0A8S4G294_PLUXY|nr:unnamed protein product [Plutella xylostella]
MDSEKKLKPKPGEGYLAGYNPWSLLFKPRARTESETSATSSTSGQTYQAGSPRDALARHSSKDEEYLWMMWRS